MSTYSLPCKIYSVPGLGGLDYFWSRHLVFDHQATPRPRPTNRGLLKLEHLEQPICPFALCVALGVCLKTLALLETTFRHTFDVLVHVHGCKCGSLRLVRGS